MYKKTSLIILFLIITFNVAISQQVKQEDVFYSYSDEFVYHLIQSLEDRFNIQRDEIDNQVYYGFLNEIYLAIDFRNREQLTLLSTLPSKVSYRKVNDYNLEYLFQFVKQNDGNVNAHITIFFQYGVTVNYMVRKINYYLDGMRNISEEY